MTTESKVTLSETNSDHSVAEIEQRLSIGEASVVNSLRISANADPSDRGDYQVWLSMRERSWTSLDWTEPSISRSHDLIVHSFSKIEAEALVAVLSHELKKLEEAENFDPEIYADEKVQRMFGALEG